MDRRSFLAGSVGLAVAATLPQVKESFSVYLMGDGDYIAARSMAEAQQWYQNWTGERYEFDDITEYPIAAFDDDRMTIADEDHPAFSMPLGKYIREEVADGTPAYLWTDGHYC